MLRKRGLRRKTTSSHVLRHKFSWVGLALLFMLGFIAIATLIYFPAITGSAVQVVNYGPAGTELAFEVRDVEGVKDVTATFLETVKSGKIYFVKNESIKFNGVAYNKFRVTSADEDKIDSFLITLKLREEELLRKEIAVGDVRLYINGKEQETVMTAREGAYYYYSVRTSQFGDYVIGKKNVPAAKVEPVVVQEEMVVEPVAEEEEEPLVGEAIQEPVIEQPAPVLERTWWMGVKEFFSGLFN
ncbi:TPA: hypothetical protein HA241_00875 [Candidatus Woesearchaeota archaeon]|nr:hypothetical protein [Candidatus Woesearchaeota archaeon]